jgi:hypothetical protein
MLELNCSYEESKKILELGYDFNSICTLFTDGNPIYVKINEGLYLPTYADVWGGVINSGIFAGSLPAGAIPLIPKAALEACLPSLVIDEDGKRDYFLSYNGQKKPTYHYHKYSELFKEETATYLNYESAFEAFLWLHENYPEELKAKFSEVMA